MNISHVQSSIRSLADAFFTSIEKKIPKEVETVLASLEPFMDVSVEKYVALLAAVADEYQRSGTVVFPSPPTRTRAAKKVPSDPEAVDRAVARLTEIYEQATSPDLSTDTVRQAMAQLNKDFDKAGILAVAGGFGVDAKSSMPKKALVENIQGKITERMDNAERVRAVSQPLMQS